MILRLPLPPALNRWPRHGLALHAFKNRYRKRAWAAAIQQERPLHDPPAKVRLHAMFLVYRLRDEGELSAGLKFVLDALKQRQTGKVAWRQGLFDTLGYFVEDDPAHLELGDVWQNTCGLKLQEIVVEIEPLVS